MGSVRVAIVGVGNCAASLVQGVEYYKDADPAARSPASCTSQFGDVPRPRRRVRRRVRRRRQEGRPGPRRRDRRQREQHHQDLRRAARPASRSSAATPSTASASTTARPSPSPTTSRSTSSRRCARPGSTSSSATCRSARSRPRSSTPSARSTPEVAFVNALPVFIAGTKEWADKFTEAGVPIVGDDIKSQVGATITHRVLAKLFEDRGVTVDRTYQLNVGGNMDFKNMLERDRLESKKISKTQSVTSQLQGEIGRAQRAHRPVRLRRLARRPQVGVRPPRGPHLRRRPAEPGVQARGLGLAELGRRHHRRDARREDRQGPRHRRPDPRPRRPTS